MKFVYHQLNGAKFGDFKQDKTADQRYFVGILVALTNFSGMYMRERGEKKESFYFCLVKNMTIAIIKI